MPLTTIQMTHLALAWQCFDSEPKINYAKFARLAGSASEHSARETMRVTKKKLKDEYGALGGGGGEGTPTPTPTPKKKTPASTPRSATPKTPGTGTGKRGRPGAKKARAEMGSPSAVRGGADGGGVSEDDDEEDLTPHAVKKMKKMNGVKTESKEDESGSADADADAEGEDDLFQ